MENEKSTPPHTAGDRLTARAADGDDGAVLPPDAGWWSFDALTNERVGPMAWSEVIARATPQVSLWRPPMSKWQTREEVEKLGWFYVSSSTDNGGVAGGGAPLRVGPLFVDELAARVRDGSVDGLTLFWRAGMSEWTPAAEIDSLREHLVAASSEEEREHDGEHTAAAQPATTSKAPAQARDGAVHSDNPAVGEAVEEEEEPADEPQRRPPPAKPGPSGLEAVKQAELKRQEKRRKRERQRLRRVLQGGRGAVYFCGVPPDTTERQLAEFFSKCGVLRPRAHDGEPDVKLYRNERGELKGDGVVTYLQEASVDNAILLLDGGEFLPGWKLSVSRAEFQLKGGHYVPPPKKQRADVAKELTQRKLSWNDGQDDGRGLRIVILLHCFDAAQIADGATSAYEELQEDMEQECAKFGELEKVTVFERSELGAVAVKFKSSADAERCIETMQGRWFDGRQLHAEFYDGRTDYRVRESEQQKQRRLERWEQWLEDNPAPPSTSLSSK